MNHPEHPDLAEMLAPTFASHTNAAILLDRHGQIAVIALTTHPHAELHTAAVIYLALDRGPLVIT